jgi:hypothetical protein
MSLTIFKRAMLERNRDLLDSIDVQQWPVICAAMCLERPTAELSALFHSRWIQYGGSIRAHTKDDALLLRALRAWLPPYEGNGLELYRGESVVRLLAGRVGLCWTPDRAVAKMFGSGLNAASDGGGCLLRSDVPKEAILSGPNSHSKWLGEDEYVVDSSMLGEVTVVERFPEIR